MSNVVRDRLKKCFHVVFPALPEANIPGASVATVAAWDSITAVALLQVIGEEFQIEVDLERLAELDSFESLAAFLSEHGKS